MLLNLESIGCFILSAVLVYFAVSFLIGFAAPEELKDECMPVLQKLLFHKAPKKKKETGQKTEVRKNKSGQVGIRLKELQR